MITSFVHSTYCNAALFGGLLFVIMGYLIARFPPKSVNAWYGYRSFLSTRNQEMWEAANKDAAFVSKKVGFVLMLIGICCALIFDRQSDWFMYITVGTLVAGVLYIVGDTEWMLSNEFDDDGNRKSPPKL
ncbi:SdpI family protein [Chitinophaga sp. sic0106]|uniref:SdpI family protein n=1 Tax=Chitinophaga sp. sic0106 TaxID=2854785 RepID=UPI001C48F46E|nr:SdpI family protein [Chitinophaga sp. sic0106]MBV7531221.1 SdpI family protein [Chitinophaga sp. sic0106]